MRCRSSMRGVVAAVVGACAASAVVMAPTASAEPGAPGPNFLTQSHRVLCAVTPDSTIADPGVDAVVCQGDFTQPGAHFQAITHGDGKLEWQDANLAIDNPTTDMRYGQTYHRGNWTIFHDSSGTRFTDDRTGHGMFVSIENVYAF